MMMHTTIKNGNQVVVIEAESRDELNKLTNKAEDFLFDKFGDCFYDEERVYDDTKPEIDGLNVVDVKDFRPAF